MKVSRVSAKIGADGLTDRQRNSQPRPIPGFKPKGIPQGRENFDWATLKKPKTHGKHKGTQVLRSAPPGRTRRPSPDLKVPAAGSRSVSRRAPAPASSVARVPSRVGLPKLRSAPAFSIPKGESSRVSRPRSQPVAAPRSITRRPAARKGA